MLRKRIMTSALMISCIIQPRAYASLVRNGLQVAKTNLPSSLTTASISPHMIGNITPSNDFSPFLLIFLCRGIFPSHGSATTAALIM
ncbi:hypothetical protein BCR42DRAFT_399377 [Absidia repens]|uniref:Uncharacterized protein n=1 Tax=Absidia repens TaxID=90262 RepID=A0A1X2IZT2_9FUNG|nr:hypothetical protein BCR42DRAFT_399377 [Absidia repens]